jgi:hypothetical protein
MEFGLNSTFSAHSPDPPRAAHHPRSLPLLGPRPWCHRLVGPSGQLPSVHAQPSSLDTLQIGPTRQPDVAPTLESSH